MKNIFLTMSLGIGLLFPCKLHAQSQYPFQNTTLSTEERVDDLIKRMTLEEKIDLLSGYNDFYLHPCERLGIPAFKLADGPLGVASWGLFGRATAFPSALSLAASWNKNLAEKTGAMYAQEWRARGIHFLLAPGVNNYRASKGARNFEYFGEDPYLASEMVVPFIKAVQDGGVIATIKHFAANDQEFDRYTWQSLGGIEKRMLNFLENHDEQRIASDFFAGNPRKAIPGLIVSACMNTNPMMIYFGQEFGELGMDSEGFSGRDGRTTIFDYWSVDTIRRWRNGGKFDGKMLTEDQKHIYSIYQRILTLCNKEKAITEGEFFDLMYANANGWRFNEHKQYTFLRKAGKELLFIIVNFDHISVDVAINVPSHAFDFLQIPQMDVYPAVDLLTGKTESISLLPYKATEISVEGYSGKILKIKL